MDILDYPTFQIICWLMGFLTFGMFHLGFKQPPKSWFVTMMLSLITMLSIIYYSVKTEMGKALEPEESLVVFSYLLLLLILAVVGGLIGRLIGIFDYYMTRGPSE